MEGYMKEKKLIIKIVMIVLAVILMVSFMPAAVPVMHQAAAPATQKYSVTYTVHAAARKVFYATYSKKYHRTKKCRTLKRSKKIYKVTEKAAKKKHLKKCKVCW